MSKDKKIHENMQFEQQRLIRNFGIAAHIDSGKTTVSERMLFITNKIHVIKEVHGGGGATTDWDEQEKARGITISSAAISFEYKGLYFNLIDTPGHVDFTVEVERSLRVLDGAILLFDAVEKVEPQSLKVSQQAEKYKVPIIAFVNKLDKPGASYEDCIVDIQEKLNTVPVQMVVPIFENINNLEKFCGLVELTERKYYRWGPEDTFQPFKLLDVPSDYKEAVDKAYINLVDKVLLLSEKESLFEEFERTGEIELETLRAEIRKLTIERKLLPVFAGAALRNKGIQILMDAVIHYLPSPLDRPDAEVSKIYKNGDFVLVDGEEQKIYLPSDVNGPPCLFIFKTQIIPKIGSVTFARCYSGTIVKGDTLFNASAKKSERISRLSKIHANKLEDVNQISAGDIVGLILSKEMTKTGDTLCREDNLFKMSGIEIPLPVVKMSLEAKNNADEEKVSQALRRMSFDDPSLVVERSQHNELIIAGMGTLHLDVIKERLRIDHNLKVETGPAKVSYLSTVNESKDKKYELKKQTGGAGQFAVMSLRIEPADPGTGFQFVSEVVGGVIPTEFIPAIKQGLNSGLKEGLDGNFPTTDLKITVYDGASHDVDSSALAFEIAAKNAIREAIHEMKIKILEPMMNVHVTFPKGKRKEIEGDIARRRGRIIPNHDNTDFASNKEFQNINAILPLAEMFDYTNFLRSTTQGYGSSSMTFFAYEPVSDILSEKIRKAEPAKIKVNVDKK